MRERSPLYNDIKRIAETDLGVRTQCMLSRHLRKRQEQYCVNLGLKINAVKLKLGTSCLTRIRFLTQDN